MLYYAAASIVRRNRVLYHAAASIVWRNRVLPQKEKASCVETECFHRCILRINLLDLPFDSRATAIALKDV